MFRKKNKNEKPSSSSVIENNEKPFIQPKLNVGKPGDKYEVEADKMADQVVNNSGSEASVQKKEGEEEVQQKPLASEISPLIQKMEISEEEPVQKMEEEEPVQKMEEEEVQQKEEEEVQAKSTDNKKKSPSIEGKLRNGSGGTKMDNQTKNEMESGFGADFSQVNIHNDNEAAQMSQDIGAQAFTHGNDVYFNKGKYNPDSKEGKHLLAHELTHTVQQKGMVHKKEETEPDNSDSTYKTGTHKIENSNAVIRNKSNKWASIVYVKNDPDLPTKLSSDKKEIPDNSFVGKNKTIPDGLNIDIDDVFILKSKSKTSNDKIKYVHVVGYGWTSVTNIKGGLKNYSVGTLEAKEVLSSDPNHYTIGVKNAVILKEGNRYPKYKDNRKLTVNSEIDVEKSFNGYYENNKTHKISEVKNAKGKTFTSTGNFAKEPSNKKEPNKRKITDSEAFERKEISSYIPDGKKTISLGKFVIIGNVSEKKTGNYVELFEVSEKKEGDNTIYSKGNSIGWTNMLNLTKGFNKDLKGLNAKWDQVIPDERYDRAKGKDTQGTAKFVGNEDMIKIVDSRGDIELVSKQIWPSLNSMLSDANSAGQSLQLNTGFRDWDYQQALVDNPNFAANPVGFSSHQIGIAVDLNNKSDIETGGRNWWMERNAYKYGFIKTYKKKSEGHHWEYRPSEVVSPKEVTIKGVKYIKYTFATYTSNSTNIWYRSFVLDKVPTKNK